MAVAVQTALFGFVARTTNDGDTDGRRWKKSDDLVVGLFRNG